jgi:DNA-binding response OmpR family regulator
MADQTAARPRVLVVEDEPDLREIAQIVLEEDGFEVQTASDGKLGLELLLSWDPDVVLLDMGLPVLSGEELVAAMRAEMPDPPSLVVMSAAGTIVERAARLGAKGCVAKPFDLDELSAVVRQALNGRGDQTQDGGLMTEDGEGETELRPPSPALRFP